eukprot:TRINITY_DN1055_c0_g1_i3.p1 TRINITY_DN1055_c0_g1~~TRINITY_DN1055_c0_g1_i3.p1  ORF type:complete len:385 (-),score=98.96 TRINITY_DN1055_c0_g1_i3:126-1280(-)
MKITPYLDNFYENYELQSSPPSDISHLLSLVSTPAIIPQKPSTPVSTNSKSSNSKSPPEDEEENDSDEYSATANKGKRKRKGKKKQKISKTKKQKEEEQAPEEEPDLLSLVPCLKFSCKPEVLHPRKQPFYLRVHTNALLLIDLHSHLLNTIEIIGFLGGRYLEDEKVLHIQEAFPCIASEEADDMNVEVDPVSEIETSDRIKGQGMQVVGWYHSHPLFQPDPSVRDIQTQKTYQHLFRDEKSGANCFVGAIDATYDNRVPTLESIFNWFFTREENGKDIPFCFSYEIVEDETVSEQLSQKMVELVKDYTTKDALIDLDMQWKEVPAVGSADGSNGDHTVRYTFKDKMRASLESRMPRNWSQDEKTAFFEQLIAPITKSKGKDK